MVARNAEVPEYDPASKAAKLLTLDNMVGEHLPSFDRAANP